jgi:hypothetical protein
MDREWLRDRLHNLSKQVEGLATISRRSDENTVALVLDDIADKLIRVVNLMHKEPKPAKRVRGIPRSWPVQPLRPGQVARDPVTCGTCGLSWDDAKTTSMTPAPSGRCPFESFHRYEGGKRRHGGGRAKGSDLSALTASINRLTK